MTSLNLSPGGTAKRFAVKHRFNFQSKDWPPPILPPIHILYAITFWSIWSVLLHEHVVPGNNVRTSISKTFFFWFLKWAPRRARLKSCNSSVVSLSYQLNIDFFVSYKLYRTSFHLLVDLYRGWRTSFTKTILLNCICASLYTDLLRDVNRFRWRRLLHP